MTYLHTASITSSSASAAQLQRELARTGYPVKDLLLPRVAPDPARALPERTARAASWPTALRTALGVHALPYKPRCPNLRLEDAAEMSMPATDPRARVRQGFCLHLRFGPARDRAHGASSTAPHAI